MRKLQQEHDDLAMAQLVSSLLHKHKNHACISNNQLKPGCNGMCLPRNSRKVETEDLCSSLASQLNQTDEFQGQFLSLKNYKENTYHLPPSPPACAPAHI